MRLAGSGWELALAIVGFAGVGYFIGGYFGSARNGLIIGSMLGVVGGLYNLVKTALRISRESNPESDVPPER